MAHKKTFISALALVMFLLPACGSDKDEFPTGQWTATDPIEGVLMIDYRADGTWSVHSGEVGVAIEELEQFDFGTYTTTEDTITFQTDEYCRQFDSEVGVYSWELEDDQLTLTMVDDSCAGRMGTLDGAALDPVGS